VVFGDIGTSPLYAVKECFSGAHGLPVTRENVLGPDELITEVRLPATAATTRFVPRWRGRVSK